MHRSIEKMATQYSWATAIATTVILISLLNMVATPLLNSGDDAYLMYTLGGGYGEAPTQLLHYNDGWHPWLGVIVKNLFVAFPSANWYSLTLLFFHASGCTLILFVLLKRMKPLLAFFFFMILFFFVETRMLLSLTFTGAAFVAATGAGMLLIHQLQQNKVASFNSLISIIILLAAGMLRLQIAWVDIFLFIPAVITMLNRQQRIRWLIITGMFVLLLMGLNTIQEHQYKKHIAGWEQQEKFRQAMFYAFNRPLRHDAMTGVFKDSAEQQLFFAGFLYDSVEFNTARVAVISRQITRQRWMNDKEDRQGLYWFIIEMRIYILLFFVIIIPLLVQQKYAPLKKWLLSFLAVMAIYGYLFIFFKITTPIHLGLLMVLWIQLALSFKKEDEMLPANKRGVIAMALSFLLLFGWMGIRVAKQDKANRTKHLQFLCVVNEINQHPGQLFVATDDSFPLGYFYIWNEPRQYPVQNLLYKDRLLTHTYRQTLHRFGITNLNDAMVNNDSVFLLGPALPALAKSIGQAHLSDTIPGYHCFEVRRLNPTP